MPWVGFFARKPRAQASDTSTSSSSKSAVSSSPVDDFDDDSLSPASSSATQPQVRELTPAEAEKLQAENAQLRALLAQLAERAQAEATSSSSSPSAGPTAGPPRAFVFQHVPHAHAPSAPPLDSSAASSSSSSSTFASFPSAATGSSSLGEQPPQMADFLESLRRSLAQVNTGTGGSKTAAPMPKSAASEEEEDDEWGAPSRSPAAAQSASSSSAEPHAPAADEAIVHTKHTSVVVRKKPLRRPKDDEAAEGTSTAASAPSAAAAAAASAVGGLDDFDDDFGDMSAGSSTVASAPTSGNPSGADGDDDVCEEVAVFDLSQADWWHLVPHPDRPDEEVQARPTPPDPNEDEDGFVVVRSSDPHAALGEFLAGVLARHPGAGQLSPDQLRAMLESSLESRGLRDPGAFGRVWQWGSKAYTVWQYGQWGWALYKDQTYLRMAAAGAIKAATWIAVFLI